MVDLASRRSTGGASSGSKHCVSPAKRPRNGPRSIAHDSSAAAAAEAAAALPSSPEFSLRAAGGGGGGRGGGAPLATRGHTPAHAGGHRVSVVVKPENPSVNTCFVFVCTGSSGLGTKHGGVGGTVRPFYIHIRCCFSCLFWYHVMYTLLFAPLNT